MGKLFTAAVMMMCVMMVTTVYCEVEYKDEDLRIYEGRVTNVGRSDLTVKGALDIKFQISLDTKIYDADNEDAKLSDIDAGDYVTVEYYRQGQDSRKPAKVLKVRVEYKKGSSGGGDGWTDI